MYHLIRPAADAPSRGCIFYVHGGGFVSTSFELYDASVAYLARSGYTVVGVDYPLAPLSRHPQPVMSVLAAVEHFVAHEGSVGDLILMGDSAGANIALMAAAVLVNPPLMQLMQGHQGPVPTLTPANLPGVQAVVAVYGMMGGEMAESCSSGLRGGMVQQISESILRLLWRLYTGSAPACQLPPKFLDWLQSDGPFSSIRMPPVLLSCGDADPVVLSSHCIAKAMAQRGMTAELILYPGTHAFFGVPSAWTFGSCHSNAMPLSQHILQFLSGRKCSGDHGAIAERARLAGCRRVRWEGIGIVVYSQIMLLPLLISGAPYLLYSLFTRRWHNFKPLITGFKGLFSVWVGLVTYDLLRAAFKLDNYYVKNKKIN